MSDDASTHRDDRHETRGLAFCDAAATDVTPSNYLENIERFRMTPIRSIGIGAKSSLKASFWRTDIEDSEVSGDPDYGSVMVHLGGGRGLAQRRTDARGKGSVSMQPFENTRWRLEGMVSFAHIFVPLTLLGDVSESIFDRGFAREHLWIPMATRMIAYAAR